jgi:ABC-type nickel/cobalt efflux system permease component RcnA
VSSAIVLGFILGLQHATDADHLVAVATIVTRERRFAAGAFIGALWGVGHTATLAIAGAALYALNLTVSAELSAALELVVAVMLVGLGVWRLREALSLGAMPDGHPIDHAADHAHDGVEVVHRHPHEHGGRLHDHSHLHPSRTLLRALRGNVRAGTWKPLVVGAVHGLAGSAAVSLLVLATVRSGAEAALYVGLFGAGTIVGMTVLTATMAYPVTLALRFERARRALAVLAGAGSIAFGLVYGYRAV